MKKDDIRTFITIIIVCLVVVITVLIINQKTNSEKLTKITEYNTYFTAVNHINSYLNYISTDQTKLYNILYKDYIEKENITKDTLQIGKYPFGSTIKVDTAEYTKVGNNYLYYFKGKIKETTFDAINLIDNNFQIIVLRDIKNLSYAVYPITTENPNKVIDSIKKINITPNSDNQITESELISKEQICILYLSDYIEKLNNNIEEAYEELNKDAKSRYKTLSEYQAYISQNKSKITTEADRCAKKDLESGRIYTVIDKNQNTYIFYEKSVLDYEVNITIKEN